jgi:pimeloyl-ACP methyl ester carboxylesterase
MTAMRSFTVADGTQVWFSTHGEAHRPTILLGPHFYASYGRTKGDDTEQWIERLALDFFVIVADYPRGFGRTGNPLGMDFTPAVAATEYEQIADAAGVERFGWLGYSYGGAIGIQVACRSARVSALAVGGFPPIDAPFQEMVDVTSRLATTPPAGWDADPKLLWSPVGFYSTLLQWPEREAIEKLTMPRMAFIGTQDRGVPSLGIETSLVDTVRHAEPELNGLGWKLAWIEGRDHMTAIQSTASLQVVHDFFRQALLCA